MLKRDPLMLQEAREAPTVTERLLRANTRAVKQVAEACAARQPTHVVTVARGSSDHAATFLKYAFETQLGLPVSSAAPSITSIYHRPLKLAGALVLAVSQSGLSPDVVETVEAARMGGALTVAIVNRESSPLAEAAEFVLPLHAGYEGAVAATKTYLASLVAGLQLADELAPDPLLQAALARLPAVLDRALDLEEAARARAERYRFAQSMIVLGRGPHYGVAQESAHKLKETTGIHSEAYSAAEFMHGPLRIIAPGYPVIAFQSRDEAAALTLEAYQALEERGADMLLIGADADLNPAVRMVTPETGHRLTDPVVSALAFYLLTAHVALARGLDPDNPPFLRKVTLTR
jgi:glucosamine--fructose-6-phosphate aminotransferase (isomerizing)